MTVVMIAVDETDESIDAARRARELFGSDATYLAVNVADRVPDWHTTPMRWGSTYRYPYAAPYPLVEEEVDTSASEAEIDRARDTARAVAAEADVAAAPIGQVGDPVEAIVEAANTHGADVIVVGSSDKSWWRQLIDRSVSEGVLRETSFPVLVARRSVEK